MPICTWATCTHIGTHIHSHQPFRLHLDSFAISARPTGLLRCVRTSGRCVRGHDCIMREYVQAPAAHTYSHTEPQNPIHRVGRFSLKIALLQPNYEQMWSRPKMPARQQFASRIDRFQSQILCENEAQRGLPGSYLSFGPKALPSRFPAWSSAWPTKLGPSGLERIILWNEGTEWIILWERGLRGRVYERIRGVE